MYLKKIEVQGFKSFANKITFDFHQGITGIVGPNGSGKSNVSDAVRWVLGEQSAKQLRGGNMQDVIFSGTEMRKPQGFAFVAITMDNSDKVLPIDFPEVTISRRIYRSGESEYMINGSACRLKDISELLYDTGIGQDGYSIIGQGQVDKILSAKTEDRRELFDEAAGITKYKRRKMLAQKKLEHERASLLRINDILSELEKQVGPLEKQSEIAREYLRLKEELKKYEIHQFLFESNSLDEKLAELNKNEDILQNQLDAANTVSESLKEKYSELESRVKEESKRIEEIKEELTLSNISIREHEGRIGILKEQIRSEELSREHIDTRATNINREIENKTFRIKDYKQKLAVLEEDYKKKFLSGQKAEKELIASDESIMLSDKEIEDIKSGIIAGIHEKAELSSMIQRYETLMEQNKIRKSELAGKLLHIQSEGSAFQKKYKDEREKLHILETKIEDMEKTLQNARSESAEYKREVFGIRKRIEETESTYRFDEAKLESMKNIAERYDGYGNSIKKIMESRDRVKGIHGVVADLLSMDKKYEIAIETALGGRIQNIVTDSEDTAKILIEYLKKNKFGRATFLPLSAMKNRKNSAPEQLRKEKGVVGIASDLIRTREEYKSLFESLLGRIYIVDNIDNAVAIAKKYRYEYRLVTIEGESLSPGGSISGGAFKNSGNLLGRKREIADLEKKLDISLRRSEELSREEKTMKEKLFAAESVVEALSEQRQESLIQRSALSTQVQSLFDKVEEIKDSAQDFIEENARLDAEVEEIRERKREFEEEISRLENRNTDMELSVSEQNRKLENAKKDREKFAQKLESTKLQVAEAKQNLFFLQENINRVSEELKNLYKEKEELTVQAEEGIDTIGEKNTEIAEKENLIEDLRKKIDVFNWKVKEKTAIKESDTLQMKNIFEDSDNVSKEISALDKDLYRIRAQKEKAEERLSSLTAYMWSEYELSYRLAEELRDKEIAENTDFKKITEELKKSVRALGNVNVNAIEDYKEVNERYTLMKTQHADIVCTEQELLKIIEELDIGMKRQFEERFSHIRKAFDEVFKELFGGGSGNIELDADKDILEADIYIIAQPPGKKLQNMMQLSGGEKALTAISLLFAIQNLKPSPFALLDEIEAALDDSNVDRFAKYLHKLCDRTQFIVITHRRGTMVHSDRLYGITMQEKGVSTLVSVNLIEDKLDK